MSRHGFVQRSVKVFVSNRLDFVARFQRKFKRQGPFVDRAQATVVPELDISIGRASFEKWNFSGSLFDPLGCQMKLCSSQSQIDLS